MLSLAEMRMTENGVFSKKIIFHEKKFIKGFEFSQKAILLIFETIVSVEFPNDRRCPPRRSALVDGASAWTGQAGRRFPCRMVFYDRCS